MSTLFELLATIKSKPGLFLGTAFIINLRMFIQGYRFARNEVGITNTEAESDLKIDVIEYFEAMAQEKGISCQELINLYLQDCVASKRELSFE